jgi:hypothetical protein
VVHAAAVSDYGVDMVVTQDGAEPMPGPGGKISSGGAPVLRLKPNPRLVDGLRDLGRTPFTLIAFKLTHGAGCGQVAEAVQHLFRHSHADYVVHNDLLARTADGRFPADILRPDGTVAAHCPDRAALAAALTHLLETT